MQTSAESSSGARSWLLKRRVKIEVVPRERFVTSITKNANRYLPFPSKYMLVFYDVTIAGGYDRGKCNC
jgi:hypothetical protein